jgi:hypothetical protein
MKTLGFTLIETVGCDRNHCGNHSDTLPVLHTAKASAKQASCLSNLRQVGLATEMYKEANDSSYPIVDPRRALSYGSDGKVASFDDPLLPYGATAQIYHCPDVGPSGRTDFQSTDYQIRFVFLLQKISNHKPDTWQSHPDNNTVIAFCTHHSAGLVDTQGNFKDTGSFNVIRGDTSASRINAAAVKLRPFDFGEFAGVYDPTIESYIYFPGEPWPPALTRLH